MNIEHQHRQKSPVGNRYFHKRDYEGRQETRSLIDLFVDYH